LPFIDAGVLWYRTNSNALPRKRYEFVFGFNLYIILWQN